jgi:arylsulfatase A
MMKQFMMICLLACTSTALSASNAPKTWTDPVKASEDPDFMIQGEYGVAGAGQDWGIQVVALGAGQFDAYLLKDGLPGYGWDRSKSRITLHGSRQNGIVTLASADGGVKATISKARITVLRNNRKIANLRRIKRKSPTLGKKPPQDAVVLFDGSQKTADLWTNGKAENGLLPNLKLTTKETFGDYHLHLEFRTPYKPFARGQQRGNSGVYHQGRYETQVLDSFGLEGKNNECGGIYSIAQSRLNMCYPPLTWQTYDVDFRAARFDNSGTVTEPARMTVRLNGEVIHEDQDLPKITTAAPITTITPAPGPIHIQHHGNPVYYRNIWIVPKDTKEMPNIVYIVADDLGYGDLGCYGQKDIRTPFLDRMAHQGMRFTQHYSGSTVCAPSRSCLMTGLHTGHTPIRGNKEIKPEGQHPLPAATVTLAEILKKVGYTTGAFGKWGLGYPGSEGDPLKQGFDTFYGYNCQRIAHNYYPHYLWDNDKKQMLPGNAGRKIEQYGPDLIQEHTLGFIEAHKDKPFFLFVPIVLPHAELFVPEDEIVKSYRGKFDETPYQGIDDGPQYKVGGYGSVATPKANFAAMITRTDRYVGQILEKLKALKLDHKTLVIFTSDNGPHAEGGANPSHFDSNGVLRGQKRDLYEGGIRVPMLAWWPGKIKAGSESHHISAFWDVLPTFAELADITPPANTDGISFVPTLMGHMRQQKTHPHLYWEFHEQGGKQAVRQGKWKAIRLQVKKNPNAPIALYDLENDIQEKTNLAAQHPEVVSKMATIMNKSHVHSDVFTFGQSAYQAGKKKD